MSLVEVLPIVQQLTPDDKLRLIRILAEQLEPKQETFPFQPHKVYYLYTPYNMYGVARLLRETRERAQNHGG